MNSKMFITDTHSAKNMWTKVVRGEIIMKKIFAILLAVSIFATSIFAEGYFINKVGGRSEERRVGKEC